MRTSIIPSHAITHTVAACALVALATIAAAVPAAARREDGAAPTTRTAPTDPAGLFDGTAVWTVHLTLTPEQWAAMEPTEGTSVLALMLGVGPANRRPAAPPPRASLYLAPAMMRDGDADADGKLTRAEFRTVGERWFAAWDSKQAGKLDAAQLRAGLGATLTPPAGAAPLPDRTNAGIGFSLQGTEGKRNGLASAMGIEFDYVHADLDFQGRALKDVAVRYKGNGTFVQSRAMLKRSLKVDLNGHAKDQSLAGVTSLNLHNCVTDISWMNEVLSHRLYRDAGLAAPRTAYARVYVTVPGKHERKYFGLYSLVEDIGKTFVKDRFGTTDGLLIKPVTPDLFADLGDDWAKYNQTYDPKSKPTEAQARRVIEFARLVTRATDEQFAARLGEFLDVDAFARYMSVTAYLSALDGILLTGQNYYVHLDPRTNQFQFIPWDLDLSFGQFAMVANQEQRERLSIRKPWRGRNRFLERVFKVPAFQEAYQARTKEFGDTIFKPERFHRQVDETAAAIRDAVREESAARLTSFDKVVAGESVPQGGGGAFGLFKPPPIKPIKPFVTARWQSVSEQLAGKSEGLTLDAGGRGRGRRDGGQAGGVGGAAAQLGPAVMTALDVDKDGAVTRDEAVAGFAGWFEAWDADKVGVLTDEQLRAGIDRSLNTAVAAPTTAPARGVGDRSER